MQSTPIILTVPTWTLSILNPLVFAVSRFCSSSFFFHCPQLCHRLVRVWFVPHKNDHLRSSSHGLVPRIFCAAALPYSRPPLNRKGRESDLEEASRMAGVPGRLLVCLTKDLNQVPSVLFRCSIQPSYGWLIQTGPPTVGNPFLNSATQTEVALKKPMTKVLGSLYLMIACCLLCRHVKTNQSPCHTSVPI